MLDRLPDEVVCAIINQLIKPAHAGGLSGVDKKALRHVCLSSRRLRRLAQPALWHQVLVDCKPQLDKVHSTAAATDLGRHAKRYAVDFLVAHTPAALAVWHVMPNVGDLRLHLQRSAPAFDLLENFTNLRRLDLSGLILTADPNIILPHLEKLTVQHSRVDVDTVIEWLQPSSLPALRCLHWFSVIDIGRTFMPQLDTLLHPLLLEQLDYIFTLEKSLAPDSELSCGVAPRSCTSAATAAPSSLGTPSSTRRTSRSRPPPPTSSARSPPRSSPPPRPTTRRLARPSSSSRPRSAASPRRTRTSLAPCSSSSTSGARRTCASCGSTRTCSAGRSCRTRASFARTARS